MRRFNSKGVKYALYRFTLDVFAGAMEPLSVADGSAFPAKELGTFDVTVANILAEPIMRLEPVFAHFARPGDAIDGDVCHVDVV